MTTRKKRILHFIDSGGLYGAEQVILNLSECMFAGSDFEPVIGCIVQRSDESNDLFQEAQRRGLRAEKFVIRNGLLLIDLPRVAREIRVLGIDLIHSHGYKPSVFGYLMKPLSGIPAMATCHLWFKDENRPLKMRLMIWLELKFYRKFPTVVGVSEDIRDVLVEAGIEADRVRVVNNGVPIENTLGSPSDQKQLRMEFCVEAGDLLIINTGRLTRQKSQITIIEAAALLRKKSISFHVFIVGEGDLYNDLEGAIQRYDLVDFVHLLGYRSDITSLLSTADIFVLPSLDEGMPMSLIEAAAMRVPIVSTSVGDIPKLITNRSSGLLVPCEDPKALAEAIENLKDDPEMGQSLAGKAFHILEKHYSSSAMNDQYTEIYMEII